MVYLACTVKVSFHIKITNQGVVDLLIIALHVVVLQVNLHSDYDWDFNYVQYILENFPHLYYVYAISFCVKTLDIWYCEC